MDYHDERPAQGELDAFQVSEPMYHAKGWLKFFGILSIIGGVLYCLTIVGAVVGWIPIWIGVLLLKTAGGLESGFASGRTRDIREGFDKLRLAFKIYGILTIIGFGLMVLYFVVVIGLLVSVGPRGF